MRKVILTALAVIWSAASAYPQTFTAEDFARRTIERRAVEAVIWGMPAVNYDLMLQEMLTKTDGNVNQIVYWGRPLDWKNQTLTPNPDAIYFMAFFNTKDGPIVLDLPAGDTSGSFNGNIVTVWQMPLEDAGLLGADKGAGGKYLILPPGYAGPKPEGYNPTRSAAMPSSARTSPATAMPTSRSPSDTARRSRSIRSRRPTIRLQPFSPMPRTSPSTRRSATMRASFSTSTGSCRASPGYSATAR
jgi:hypothetical protein